MTSQIFKSFLKGEKGAVEFIESALVLSLIFGVISIFLAVSLMTLIKVRDQEIAYYRSLDQVYNRELKDFSSISKLNDKNKYTFFKKDALISTKVSLKENDKTLLEVSRIKTESLLRKIDFAAELMEEIDNRTKAVSSLKARLSDYEAAMNRLVK
ncbi:MAG: hypothetical protein Q4E50_04640 [Tissierellia bacterium]|nr:hypothetical protein [Tissierellia bacterium]